MQTQMQTQMQTHIHTFKMPLRNQIFLDFFLNMRVNEVYKGKAIIKEIMLHTSHQNPGYATLYVTAVDNNHCTFTKKFSVIYSTEILDIEAGMARLHLQIDKHGEASRTPKWYVVDENLIHQVLLGQ